MRRRLPNWLSAIAAAALGATACGDRVYAPPPALVEDAPSSWGGRVALSVVDAPIRLDLTTALAELDSVLPERWGDLDRRIGTGRTTFAFEVRREPFAASFQADTIFLTTVLHYRGRGWYNPPIGPEVGGSCGTDGPAPRARIVVRITAHLGPDWKLETRSRVHRLAAYTGTERDQCEVTFLNLDVTGRVLAAARTALRGQMPKLDRKLAAVDVKSVFEDVWLEMQQPIRLADSVWLMLQPSGVRIGTLGGSGDSVGTTVGITASPKVETGDRPLVGPVPLPEVDTLGPVQGLSVQVRGRFDYPVIGTLLTKELAGRQVPAPGGAVEIIALEALGVGGGRLALGLRFRGVASGRIYFIGTPRYDPATDRITVPDLEVDASSSSMLLRGLAWFKGDALRDFLRAKATFPSADALDPLVQLAMEGMNRELTPGVRLRAELTGTEVLHIEPRHDALYVDARAVGSASLELSAELFTAR